MTERIELDVRAERGVARLRLVAAVVVALMATILAAQGAGTIGWTLLGLSWLVALGWAFAARAARRRLERHEAWYVELSPEGLTVALGPGKVTTLAWAQLEAVDVDEDRLEVTVAHEGGLLRVPSLWRGHGLYELADRVRDAWEVSRERGA
ncbi:MAG: hypothetical protein KF901_09200 [Myxococcales bacterium]|nr:hypothetical protein [Myxococcales bacterium]